ncbi:pyridoxal phosphate-dependent aminotransferase [Faecalicatena orotica]|nr:pyridoxal phosphate-dependent aminotransferase [Faecalicatena orotica]
MYTKEYFDYMLERRGTKSSQWDGCNAKFGEDPSVEMLPMWVADMDFRVPQEIRECLHRRVDTQAYGYRIQDPAFFEAIVNWQKKRHNWNVKCDWITFVPGAIQGFIYAIRSCTAEGDGIIVQSPGYSPFAEGTELNSRKVVYNQLTEVDGRWKIDFEDLEKKVKDPKNKLLLLCNPHNPVGRAWSKPELEKLGRLCLENEVVVVSDELHSDLIIDKTKKHQVMAAVSEEILQNTITVNAPSKTFNLAGLQTAYTIIANETLRKKYRESVAADRIYNNMNWFGPDVLCTAYNQCEQYVDALCDYIGQNMDYMGEFLKENLPAVKWKKPEATYMAWVDFRGTGMSAEEIENCIVKKAHIGAELGTWFGPGGIGFIRFNLACPHKKLEQAMKQLKQACVEMPDRK